MNAWQTDPYRFPGMRGIPDDQEGGPPSPLSGPLSSPARLPGVLAAADHRRLDLHACLTTAGIPPHDGDLHAIEVLSMVDDTTYAAVRRWITRTP